MSTLWRFSSRLAIVLTFAILACVQSVKAQVQLWPIVKEQILDQNAKPLAGGCIFTFISGTNTPHATFTDFTGGTPNPNPIILDASGRPPLGTDVWLDGTSYRIQVKSFGGVNCASGQQIYLEDGITSSPNALLAQNNTFSGTNTFNGPSIFNGPVTFTVGFTSTGPSNLNAGGALVGTFSGSPIFSGTPNFSNGFLATTGTFSGQITSTVAPGTPPFVIASTTNVPNLNASSINGCTFPIPCPLGSTTPNTVASTTLNASTSFTLAGSSPQTSIQGATDVKLLAAGTFTGATGVAVCKDANGGATTVGCAAINATQVESVKKVAATCVPGSAASFDNCTDVLTWPHAFADSAYVATVTCVQPAASGASGSVQAPILVVSSYTNTTITIITQQERSITSNCSEIHAIGVHP